jgi:hypothetical protein
MALIDRSIQQEKEKSQVVLSLNCRKHRASIITLFSYISISVTKATNNKQKLSQDIETN